MDNDEQMMQQIMKMLVEIKAKMDAETKAILAETKARRDKRMEANKNDDQNESTVCKDALEANPKKMEPNAEENEAVLERQRVYDDETAVHILKDGQNEMNAYNEATETIEQDPGMMQSAEKHQDVPSEDVAVMPVNGLRKRRRGRKSTAGRRGEPKERIRGNCGSRNKLAADCRKVSRHATVAWRKRKLFRKSGTQEFCGQRKELTAAGIRKIPCAQVVRRNRRSDEGPSVEQGIRNNWTRNKFARKTRKGRTVGRGQTMRREGTNASRNRGFKEQLRCGNVRKTRWVYRTTIGMKMVKEVVGTSRGLTKIRQWTLWRDRPPPKRKKKS
jgi:hypothetical protein